PNQDFLSGKGLGNLIALPLQGITRKDGNSVFVDLDNGFVPYVDQREFLASVTKILPEKLDALLTSFSAGPVTPVSSKKKKGVLVLTIRNTLSLHRSGVPPQLVSYVREQLNILNVERLVKERAGLPTYGLPKYIKTITVADDSLHIPRGFVKNIQGWLAKKNIRYELVDKRPQHEPVEFSQRISLRTYQHDAVDAFSRIDNGVLVAPAASGKTLMGLALIAQKRQPAIILTHRRQIYEQWREQIESSFGIPKAKIGQISSTKKQAILPVTLAMVQTLCRMKNWDGIEEKFGTVILDECHHVPARMFRDVLSKFNCRYLYGLTATPERKYNDGTLISVYIGPVIHTVSNADVTIQSEHSARA
ncbi:MAG: DEAD/DEAH box helicase family protein, partial [Patescibacteria group bacterium]